MSRIPVDHSNIGDWFNHGVFIPKRLIYIGNQIGIDVDEMDAITTLTAERFTKSMCVLESTGSDTITIMINTTGGCVFSAFAIYDRIKESNCKTIVRGYGQVMSAGTIILQAGNERQLSPECWLMIHNGSNDIGGTTTKSLQNWGKTFEKMDRRAHEIFLSKMKMKDSTATLGNVIRLCSEDTIFTAREAVNIGLADKIYRRK